MVFVNMIVRFLNFVWNVSYIDEFTWHQKEKKSSKLCLNLLDVTTNDFVHFSHEFQSWFKPYKKSFAIIIAFLVFPGVVKPWNMMSFAIIVMVLLQTKPLTMVVLTKLATQKSSYGLAFDAIVIMAEKTICSTKNVIVNLVGTLNSMPSYH